MMKKHYIALAIALREIVDLDQRWRIANLVADVCKDENRLFDRRRFLLACKPQE